MAEFIDDFRPFEETARGGCCGGGEEIEWTNPWGGCFPAKQQGPRRSAAVEMPAPARPERRDPLSTGRDAGAIARRAPPSPRPPTGGGGGADRGGGRGSPVAEISFVQRNNEGGGTGRRRRGIRWGAPLPLARLPHLPLASAPSPSVEEEEITMEKSFVSLITLDTTKTESSFLDVVLDRLCCLCMPEQTRREDPNDSILGRVVRSHSSSSDTSGIAY